MTKVKEKKDFSKIDKITRNFVIVSCVVLGSIFLAACAYMLTLISDAQNEKQAVENNKTVQNMNLVNMKNSLHKEDYFLNTSNLLII